jgi:hypothetical protein
VVELQKISSIFTGVQVHEAVVGTSARFMRLADLSSLKSGRPITLAHGETPNVARAVEIEPNDLIAGARGLDTDICIANETVYGAFVSLDLYLVRPNVEVVNPQYLVSYLKLPATQALFAAGKQGSSLARLPKDALEKVEIPLPPLHVQRLIADLAQAFQEEDSLLKRLTNLNSTFARETIARAIRSAGVTQDIPRRSQ